MKKHEVIIYTDGACEPNPGPGGWACILTSGKHRKELSGYVPNPTTNNRCEMGAVIEAFRSLKKPCKVKLVTDSMICIYTLRGRNESPQKRKRRKNLDLVEKMLKASEGHEVTHQWIRGHTGHPENEKCDMLAGEALRKKRNPTLEYIMQTPEEKASLEQSLFA